MKKKTKSNSETIDYTKEELAEIIADKKYWQSYGNLIGAKLYGWTYRQHASFSIAVPTNPNMTPQQHTFELGPYHCKMIDAVLAQARLAEKEEEELLKALKKIKKLANFDSNDMSQDLGERLLDIEEIATEVRRRKK